MMSRRTTWHFVTFNTPWFTPEDEAFPQRILEISPVQRHFYDGGCAERRRFGSYIRTAGFNRTAV